MTPPRQNNESEQAIAVLGQKFEDFSEHVMARFDKLDQQLGPLTNTVHESKERICVQEERINHLSSQVKSWNLTNSLGAALALILAYFGIKQP